MPGLLSLLQTRSGVTLLVVCFAVVSLLSLENGYYIPPPSSGDALVPVEMFGCVATRVQHIGGVRIVGVDIERTRGITALSSHAACNSVLRLNGSS